MLQQPCCASMPPRGIESGSRRLHIAGVQRRSRHRRSPHCEPSRGMFLINSVTVRSACLQQEIAFACSAVPHTVKPSAASARQVRGRQAPLYIAQQQLVFSTPLRTRLCFHRGLCLPQSATPIWLLSDTRTLSIRPVRLTRALFDRPRGSIDVAIHAVR